MLGKACPMVAGEDLMVWLSTSVMGFFLSFGAPAPLEASP